MQDKNVKNTGEFREQQAHKPELESINLKIPKLQKSKIISIEEYNIWENSFNAVSDWIVLGDLDNRIIRTNEAGEKFTGLSCTEMIGQSCCKLIHNSTKRMPCCPMKQMISTGCRASTEIQLPDGKWIAVTVDPVKNNENTIESFIHIVRDITQQKKAEENLRASEQKYKNLFMQANDAIAYLDSFGRIIDVNNKVIELYGGSKKDLLKKHFTKLGILSVKDVPKYVQLFKSVLTGKSLTTTIQIKNKKGEEKLLECSASLIKPDGEPIRIMVITRDITKRKQVEEALRASEERFKGIFKNSLVGIYRTTPNGRILMANPAIVKMLGYESFKELSKVNLQEYGFAQEHSRLDFIRHIEAEGKVTGYESVWRKKDGSTLFVRESAQTIRDKDGNTLYYEGTVEDITKCKQAEQELQTSRMRLYEALKLAKLGYWEYDVTEKKFTFNDQFYNVYRTSADKVGGYKMSPERYAQLFLYPDEAHVFYDIMQKAKKSKSTLGDLRGEHRVIFGDGKSGYVSVSFFFIRDGKGNIVKTYGANQDITERKQAEDALANREAELNSILNGSDDSIYAVDGDCRYIFANDEHLSRIFNSGRISQKRSEKVIGKRYQDIHPGEESKEFIENVEKVFESGESIQYECKWPDIGKWSNRILSPIKDLETGKIKSVSVISRDITDHKQAEQELKRERNLLRLFIDNIPDRIFLKDNKHRFILGNNAVIRHKGFKSEDELIGKTDFDFYPEKEAKVFCSEEREIIKNDISVINQKCFYKDKNGNEEWSLLTKVPLRDLNGDIIGLAGIKRNVTEQKKAEDALRESEELFRTFIEQAPEAVFVHDLNGQILLANELASKYTGFSNEELLNMNVSTIDKSIIEQDHKSKYWEKLQVGENVLIETLNRVKNGIEFPVEVLIVKIIFKNKPMLLCFVRDITERKRYEENRDRLLRTIETAKEAMHITSSDLRIEYTNNAMDKLFGCRKGELIGKHVSILNAGRSAKDVTRQIVSSIEEKGFWEGEVQNIRKDGTEFTSYATISAERDKDGKIIKYFSSQHDITERKKAEENIFKYQEQLKSLASKLTITEEHERYRIATELHDHICQSLAMSKIKLETLIYSKISNDTRGSLTEVCKWLTQVIENTRSLTFDLSSPILYELGFEKAVAAWLEDEIQQKHNIETEFKDDGQFKPLDNDVRALLFRDVRELLINVVKHAHANRVKVFISKVKDRISVIVEDDGKGFDPLKIANAGINRTGFGLFSIRQRLEYSGGKFEIDSTPGKGSKITMFAPLKEEIDN